VSATAILAAAGSGERLGADAPKAFVELAGRPMLEWSLAAIEAARSIEEVIVTMPPNGTTGTVPSVPGATTVAGGPSRSESVANALARVETELVLVHDAARPLVTPELFDAIVAELEADPEAAGVIAATPVVDTTKEVLRDREVHRTLDRSSLWSIQTPQGFRTEALRAALDSTELLALASDDAMLVERMGGRVLVHEASPENLKVTTPLDLRVATELLRGRSGS
jgi:2-C-methyl-D-erythritol 4-phosphate cytidylyltransferase